MTDEIKAAYEDLAASILYQADADAAKPRPSTEQAQLHYDRRAAEVKRFWNGTWSAQLCDHLGVSRDYIRSHPGCLKDYERRVGEAPEGFVPRPGYGGFARMRKRVANAAG